MSKYVIFAKLNLTKISLIGHNFISTRSNIIFQITCIYTSQGSKRSPASHIDASCYQYVQRVTAFYCTCDGSKYFRNTIIIVLCKT